MSDQGVSNSEFYMWRTLFALAHADDIVTYEEIRFMAEVFEDVAFSDAQRRILEDDVKTPQDAEAMFRQVTDSKDQSAFFNHARRLVHIDGDYALEEQELMIRLQEIHVKSVNLDELVGTVALEFEDEQKRDFSDIGIVDFKENLPSARKKAEKNLNEKD